MMGEYMLYSDGVVFGGVYDNRFLLKDTPADRNAFPTPSRLRKDHLMVYRKSCSRKASRANDCFAVSGRSRFPSFFASALTISSKTNGL